MNMPWHSMFSFLFLYLEATLWESNWVKTTSVAVMFFFREYHSESTSSERCSKFSINNYKAPWQRHLKDTLQLKISWTSVSSLHQELIIVYYSFSQTSLVFKLSLKLIEQFLPQLVYLSIFRCCILKFIQYLYTFFIRASKFSWASILLFCEGLQLQNVIIFLWNISTSEDFHETLVPINEILINVI